MKPLLKSLIGGTAVIASMLVLSPTVANAQLLDIQLNQGGAPAQYVGAALVGTATDYWNNVQLVTSNPTTISQSSGFLNSDGVTVSSATLSLSNYDDAGAGNNAGRPAGDSLERYFIDQSPNASGVGPATVTIGGLSAGFTYNLYIISTADHQGVGGTFSVNGGTSQTAANTNDSYESGAFVVGVDSVQFTGLTANGSGQLVISESGGTSGYDVINGFQLQAIATPEPSTWAMMLMGMGALVLGLRRRQARLNS